MEGWSNRGFHEWRIEIKVWGERWKYGGICGWRGGMMERWIDEGMVAEWRDENTKTGEEGWDVGQGGWRDGGMERCKSLI